jgi:hypothetical protein
MRASTSTSLAKRGLQMSDKNKAKKLCFVIGPIGDPGSEPRRHADWLFEGIIKPVFAEHFHDEFEVPVRADQIVAPGSINTQVIARLLEAPLVIADLSHHNANAFYELAIRHMVRLPTIHMIHKDWKLPFDVAPFRAISFCRDDYADVVTARASLKSTVQEVMKQGFEVENPITHARGVINIDQHASPEQRVLLDRLEALERQIQRLDRSLPQGVVLGPDKPLSPEHRKILADIVRTSGQGGWYEDALVRFIEGTNDPAK